MRRFLVVAVAVTAAAAGWCWVLLGNLGHDNVGQEEGLGHRCSVLQAAPVEGRDSVMNVMKGQAD